MSRKKLYFAIPKEEFWAKCKSDNTTGCMIWQGEVSNTGYAISYKESGGEERLAHRWAWRLENGPLEKGAPLKWRCGNRLCLNPEHLYIAETPRGDRVTASTPRAKRSPRGSTVVVTKKSREPKPAPVIKPARPARVIKTEPMPIPAHIEAKTDKPKAVGILNGSGGMAIGFERAGFEVLGSLEADDLYGMSYRLNRPDQFHAVSIDEWEQLFPGLSDDVTLAFGHPPCQGVSGMNAQSGAENPKNEMLPLAAMTGMRMGADYVILENIPRMLSLGKEFVEQTFTLAKQHGYSMEIHKHFVGDYGVSQKRRRVLFVLTKKGKEIYWPVEPEFTVPTVWDVISDLNDMPPTNEPHGTVSYAGPAQTPWQEQLRNPEGYVWNHMDDPLPERFSHVPIGKRWDHMPREYMTEKEIQKIETNTNWFNAAEKVRVDPFSIGKTITGAKNKIHPYQCRNLTVREIARMMGFPDDWHFAQEQNWQQVAAGVCPPVCEYVGQIMMAHLAGEAMPVQEGALF